MRNIRIPKKWVIPIVLFILFVISACGDSTPGGSSFQDPFIPSLTDTGWVVDPANAMSDETERVLESLAEQINNNPDGYQIGIAVFNNAASEEVALATKFGNENGIGSSEKDNGIAIVILIDKEGGDGNAPAIGVAIGSGLEGQLNDAKVGRMLDATYVPARSDGNWEQGLIDFVSASLLVLTGEDGDLYAPEPINWTLWIIIIIVIVILVICDFAFLGGNITYIVISVASKSGGGGSFSGGGSSR